MLAEEQELNAKLPFATNRQEARCEYQKDMSALIEESRRALSLGGSLPKMPDIRDYEEMKEKKAYKEHVMTEIAAEAEQYNVSVEEYVKNGYEPGKIVLPKKF